MENNPPSEAIEKRENGQLDLHSKLNARASQSNSSNPVPNPPLFMTSGANLSRSFAPALIGQRAEWPALRRLRELSHAISI